MKYGITLLICLTIWACQDNGSKSEADLIIDECIKVHGGKAYNKAKFAFEFRDKTYTYEYYRGKYEYERLFIHVTGNAVRDVMSNTQFERYIDGKLVQLSEEKSKAYSNSVNSVNYFAFLPFFLKDKAVISEYLGKEDIRKQSYDKIKVTFSEDGGGDDFNDVYVYWIHQENKTMDYLAYSYDQPDDKGVRFRSAYNPRTISGIRFQDYVNYKHDPDTPVHGLGALYTKGELSELSRIELKNIRELKRE